MGEIERKREGERERYNEGDSAAAAQRRCGVAGQQEGARAAKEGGCVDDGKVGNESSCII